MKFLENFWRETFQIDWKLFRFLETFMVVLSIKGILYSKTYKYMRYKKVFLDENLKTRFSDINKLLKVIKKHVFLKKNPEGFSIKTIDSICVMKMLLSIN